jgi:3'(2'), 5'-bisphosphate nucleotidase
LIGSGQVDLEVAKVVAIRSVREAARLCRAVANEFAPAALSKGDKSPVTIADFGSQALICRALAEAFPADPIIAEEDSSELGRPENAQLMGRVLEHVERVRSESAGASAQAISSTLVRGWIDRGNSSEFSERFWTLDPIDGTKGFLRREQYAVALALIVNGEVVVAALACPNLASGREPTDDVRVAPGEPGSVFWAVRGGGAYQAVDVGPIEATPVGIPVRVSPCGDSSLARMCESVESGHSAHGESAGVAARLGIVAEPVRLDSQAKYAVVARGQAEIYLRMPTRADYREKIWDHAAGALIVTEAGGTVTDIAGMPLDFKHGRELLANQGVVVTSGRLHERTVRAIAGADQF